MSLALMLAVPQLVHLSTVDLVIIAFYVALVPCTIMSMMSNDLIPSACVADAVHEATTRYLGWDMHRQQN